MDRNLAYTNLLRILVWAGTTLFGLILVWQFISGVATLVLVLLPGILLAVILFWPVEELHRHKVPRILSTPLIVLGFLDLLMMRDRVPVFRRLDQQSAVVTLLGAVFGFLGALLALSMAVVAEALVEELWFWHLEEGSMED